MAITEWFKGNIETLDTLLLCVYSWRLTAQHINLKQMRGERQQRSEQELVEGRQNGAVVLQSFLMSGTSPGFVLLCFRCLGFGHCKILTQL